jgi:hypothetical protein
MTQDSCETTYLDLLAKRFMQATQLSLGFLENEGFKARPFDSRDLHEYRDAEFSKTYTRENTSIRIFIGLSNLHIGIGMYDYESEAQCNDVRNPKQAISLDRWTEENGPVMPAPLPWMKTQTFLQEVNRNSRYYFKHVDKDLEAAIEFIALRLRCSQIYKK